MEKAGKALASAPVLLDTDDSDGATNRTCYAMFDAATAALVWAGVAAKLETPKTHSGLIGSFGLPLLRTGRLAAEFGRSLNQVRELRLTGDYLAAPVPPDKAGAFPGGDDFVQRGGPGDGGEVTLTTAVRQALKERLRRERLRRGKPARLSGRLLEIGAQCAALRDLDTRSPDEIAGYDETGMWR